MLVSYAFPPSLFHKIGIVLHVCFCTLPFSLCIRLGVFAWSRKRSVETGLPGAGIWEGLLCCMNFQESDAFCWPQFLSLQGENEGGFSGFIQGCQ
jgi:hypothetical protein